MFNDIHILSDYIPIDLCVICNLDKDGKDRIRQMRLGNARINGLLRMLCHFSIDVKIVYLTVIALVCTVPICGRNTRTCTLVKFDYQLITHAEL